MNEELRAIVAQAVKLCYPDVSAEPDISYPDQHHGDFATNIGFQLARELKRPPTEISHAIAAVISHPDVEHAEAAGGYINLRLSQNYWIRQLRLIKPSYGSSQIGAGRKAQVEFISANPTGPTTFGNARGGYIGDVIARVLQHSGYEVTREYYFNNGGTQIRKLVESVRVAAGLNKVDEVQYKGPYIDDLAAEFGTKLKDATDDEAAELLTQAILKRYIEPAIAKMRISFDVWFNEATLEPDGLVDEVMTKLKAADLVYEKDGAVWLASSSLGDERNRVLRKSSGDLTYLANDIAYEYEIFAKRNFDLAIKQWGADHAGQVPSLRLIMKKLLPKKQLDFNIHQWVRLIQDGKEVKMSKRAGSYVTVEDVIDELGEHGSDITRFFMLMRSADSPMDFDLDLAKEQTKKNPMFYVMYSYARAHSIITQANARKMAPLDTITELDEHELALVRHMSRFSGLVAGICADYEVHRLPFFGMEAARLFHELYESTRIIGLDHATASRKLYLIQRYIIFMEIYFGLLGITPIRRMGNKAEKED